MLLLRMLLLALRGSLMLRGSLPLWGLMLLLCLPLRGLTLLRCLALRCSLPLLRCLPLRCSLPLLRSLAFLHLALRRSLTLRGLVLLRLVLFSLVLLCLALLSLLLLCLALVSLVLLSLVLLCLALVSLVLLLCLPLRNCLALLRSVALRRSLTLRGLVLLLRLVLFSLVLLLLRYSPIGFLQSRWGPHVVICRKRPGCCHVGRASVVDRRKLSPVRSGCLLVLHLCPHRPSMLLMPGSKFRRPCPHLHSARSAIEAHTVATPAIADGAVVDVMHR
jgi:hypothetical protein